MVGELFRRSGRLLANLAGSVLIAIVACGSAESANAGEYDVWSCRGPAGQPLSGEAWQPVEHDTVPGDVSMVDACASGGPVVLEVTSSGTGTRRSRLDLRFDLPRGARITDFRLRRAMYAAAAVGPSYAYVSAVRESDDGTHEDRGCASTLALPDFDCSFKGSETDPHDPSNVYERTGVSLDGLSAWVGCVATGGCDPPFAPPAARFTLFESVVTIADDAPPVVADIGGSLLGEPIRGSANLYVRATDSNAGVQSMELDIDGIHHQVIAAGGAHCSPPFVVPRPCPADAGRVFTIDADTLAPGPHTASGTVTDAAGNTTPFGPFYFAVADSDPGTSAPANGVPAVTTPTITPDSRSVTHGPGRTPTVSGTLVTDTGVPISGAVLNVRSVQLGVSNPSPVALADVVTGADGTFRFPVPGAGARRVEIGFAPNAGASPTAVTAVRVSSVLRLNLRARPRRVRIGKASTFSGRLRGAGPSATGAPVEIQAKSGGRWVTVATVRARVGGAFSWRYRFRFVKRDALFSFRAVVRSSPGWPWATVRSGIAKVRITMGSRR